MPKIDTWEQFDEEYLVKTGKLRILEMKLEKERENVGKWASETSWDLHKRGIKRLSKTGELI